MGIWVFGLGTACAPGGSLQPSFSLPGTQQLGRVPPRGARLGRAPHQAITPAVLALFLLTSKRVMGEKKTEIGGEVESTTLRTCWMPPLHRLQTWSYVDRSSLPLCSPSLIYGKARSFSTSSSPSFSSAGMIFSVRPELDRASPAVSLETRCVSGILIWPLMLYFLVLVHPRPPLPSCSMLQPSAEGCAGCCCLFGVSDRMRA